MKKLLIPILMIILITTGNMAGQSFDWNIRGGLNLMNSMNPDKDVALLYHAGAQAGVRIASFGFYGEALLSMNENQDGGDPLAYFVPSVIVKGYWRKYLFVEVGGSLLILADKSEVGDNTLNPETRPYMAAGLGVHFSKFEISFRTTGNSGYAVIQATAAVKF